MYVSKWTCMDYFSSTLFLEKEKVYHANLWSVSNICFWDPLHFEKKNTKKVNVCMKESKNHFFWKKLGGFLLLLYQLTHNMLLSIWDVRRMRNKSVKYVQCLSILSFLEPDSKKKWLGFLTLWQNYLFYLNTLYIHYFLDNILKNQRSNVKR